MYALGIAHIPYCKAGARGSPDGEVPARMAAVATVAIEAHCPVVFTIMVAMGRAWIMDAHVRWRRCDKRKRGQKWDVMGRVRLMWWSEIRTQLNKCKTRSIQLELCRPDYTCR